MGEVRDRPDDPPLRVFFVSRKWPPAMGGIETYAAELARELDARTELRTIVLPGRADGSVPGALALLAFGMRAAWRLATARSPAAVTHVADMAGWPLASFCPRCF